MSDTLLDELSTIKEVEDTVVGNKVANFAYDDYAYEHNDANGVDTYNVNNHQNIPNGTANILKVNPTILTKGWRAQASAITRMLIDHFLGRISYNLNKLHDNFSDMLNNLISYIGAPNGIATLDEGGKVTLTQIPKSDVAENTSNKVFTAKGAYDYMLSSPTADIWLSKVFGRLLCVFWEQAVGDISTRSVDNVTFANGIWVCSGSGMWWSEDGKAWTQADSGATSSREIVFNNGLWLCSSTDKKIWWSEDGKTWTQATGGFTATQNIDNIVFANGLWVCSGFNISLGGSTYSMWWSEDGKTWTQGTTSTTPTEKFDDLVYANGIWVCGSGKGIWWSEDGKAWTQGTGIGTSASSCVTYANGIWVCYVFGQSMWWSENGKAWTQGTGVSTDGALHVMYANGCWVCNSNGGIIYSSDGKVWHGVNLPSEEVHTQALAYIRGLWLCGCTNHIYWSTTGIYWAQGTGDRTVTAITSIKYANGLWIGEGSEDLASEDGKNWKKLTPNERVGGLVFAKGLWLGTKSGAGIWYSGAEQLLENGYFTD